MRFCEKLDQIVTQCGPYCKCKNFNLFKINNYTYQRRHLTCLYAVLALLVVSVDPVFVLYLVVPSLVTPLQLLAAAQTAVALANVV